MIEPIKNFHSRTRTGFIIDPTIRMEKNLSQPEEVNEEKKAIYEPCIPNLCEKYNLSCIEVIGLFIGARGTITNFFENFRKKFKLPKNLRDQVVLTALKGSSQILQHHLYNYQCNNWINPMSSWKKTFCIVNFCNKLVFFSVYYWMSEINKWYFFFYSCRSIKFYKRRE